ncbi:MAG: SPOR domain-containing protein [Bacteroidia bacterium]
MKFELFSKGVIFATLMLIVALSSFAQSPKQEEKFWKSKGKGYVKNPLSLKRDFEMYQNQITELKEQIAQLQSVQTSKENEVASVKNQVDSLKWENVQMKGEKQSLQKKIDKLEVSFKSATKVVEVGVKPGLIYRVQIGAFSQHEMKNKPAKADDFLEEKVDGLNKYMLGNARTQQDAELFAEELKKIGIKDAWVVPYIDGLRVTFAEANTYLLKQNPGATLPPPPPMPQPTMQNANSTTPKKQ